MSELSRHDEILTVRMPMWAWNELTNLIERAVSDHWDAAEIEVTKQYEFDIPPSYELVVEDGQRYILPRQLPVALSKRKRVRPPISLADHPLYTGPIGTPIQPKNTPESVTHEPWCTLPPDHTGPCPA